jgi:tRNA pseudouridine38-40 synthase
MSEQQRIFIRMAYNGNGFNGWQIQPNGVTVQEELQKALAIILRFEVSVVGCGRTDTGVHASEFFAHFDLEEKISISLDQIKYKLNNILPRGIAIYALFYVDPETHARFSALRRTYRYQICTSKNPFFLNSAYYYYLPLNIAAMNDAAAILFEYIDFTCFSKSNTQVKTNNCIITHAAWTVEGPLLVFTITADRFLRNMVRAIVGTLLDVGLGKLTLDGFRAVIENKNRSKAGFSVPAQGLFLCNVVYPDNLKK